jgi:hypothetical protein
VPEAGTARRTRTVVFTTRARTVSAIETFEDVRLRLGRDAYACVANGDDVS